MKLFLARLKKSDLQDPLPPRLLDEAGRLCRGLQRSQRCLAKLVEGLAQGRHWGALLTNVHVVQAAVLVRLRRHQYEAACLLLEVNLDSGGAFAGKWCRSPLLRSEKKLFASFYVCGLFSAGFIQQTERVPGGC